MCYLRKEASRQWENIKRPEWTILFNMCKFRKSYVMSPVIGWTRINSNPLKIVFVCLTIQLKSQMWTAELCHFASQPVHFCTSVFWLTAKPQYSSRFQFLLLLLPKGHRNGKFQQAVSMVMQHRTSVRGTSVQPLPQACNCEKVDRRRKEGTTTASSNRHHVTRVSGAGSQDKPVCSGSI